MHMMENLYLNHRQDGSVSPLTQLYPFIKPEPEMWNPQQVQPVSGVLAENFPTYTSLETVSPENSYGPSSNQYSSYTTSPNTVHPSYSCMQDSSVFSVLHPPDNFLAKDEGLGSSESSPSHNSSSPPSTVAPEALPVTNYHYSNYDYTRQTSSGSSAENIAYPEHFKVLVKECYFDKNQVILPQPMETSPNEKKRKRSQAMNKKNLICTNCEADETSLWRRNIQGETVCNACGLYEKLHKCARPRSMKKDTIQTRKRKPKAADAKPKRKSALSNRSPAPVKVEPYMPNQFFLSSYEAVHMRGVKNPQDTGILPPMSDIPYYENFRNEYMHHVPPNEVFHNTQQYPLSNSIPNSPHGTQTSPHCLSPPTHNYISSSPSDNLAGTQHHHLPALSPSSPTMSAMPNSHPPSPYCINSSPHSNL